VSGLGEEVFGKVKDWGGNILDFIKDIPGAIRDATGKGWETIKGGLSDMGGQISRGWDTVQGLGKDVYSGIERLGTDLGRSMSEGWGAVERAASQGWNTTKGLAERGWGAVERAASQGWNTVERLGKDIASGIETGIGSLWNGLRDMMGGISDPITGWIKDLIGRKDRGDGVDTSRQGEVDDAWAEADAERRYSRYASGATDENGNEMSVPDSSFNDTTNQGPDGNFLSSGLASLGDASGKLPGDLGDFLSSGLGRIGGLADEFSKLLPGGHGDALFGGQAKWDAEKALSQAMGYQASREARTARLQAEINAKYGVGNGPGAREARAQLSAIERAQGDAAEGLAFRQADDVYSGGLTQHRAQMQQRGTANSGQDVTGRTKLAAGLFGGRANAAMAGEKAKSDFRNTLDTSRRQTLGTALFDPINTTELANKRNAVASAKGTAWASSLGDAAGSLTSAFG
jgi:hypothetical protein